MNRPKVVVYDVASLDGRLTLAPGAAPARLALLSAQVRAEGRVWVRYQVVAA